MLMWICFGLRCVVGSSARHCCADSCQCVANCVTDACGGGCASASANVCIICADMLFVPKSGFSRRGVRSGVGWLLCFMARNLACIVAICA